MNAYNNRPLPQGFWQSAGGAYTQSPQSNQYTSTNLNNLIAGDSQYIQQARSGAQAQANARGLGNSSYAAGNAQAAAIQAALPIAQADAGVNANAALANQQALNQILQGNNQNATSIQTANIGAGASMYGSDKSYQAALAGIKGQGDRQTQQLGYDAGQADINRQYQQTMQDRQNYYASQQAQQQWSNNLYGNILQGAYGTVFSSPDYFSNPDAALGFINGFGNFAGNQINQYLYGNNP